MINNIILCAQLSDSRVVIIAEPQRGGSSQLCTYITPKCGYSLVISYLTVRRVILWSMSNNVGSVQYRDTNLSSVVRIGKEG